MALNSSFSIDNIANPVYVQYYNIFLQLQFFIFFFYIFEPPFCLRLVCPFLRPDLMPGFSEVQTTFRASNSPPEASESDNLHALVMPLNRVDNIVERGFIVTSILQMGKARQAEIKGLVKEKQGSWGCGRAGNSSRHSQIGSLPRAIRCLTCLSLLNTVTGHKQGTATVTSQELLLLSAIMKQGPLNKDTPKATKEKTMHRNHRRNRLISLT